MDIHAGRVDRDLDRAFLQIRRIQIERRIKLIETSGIVGKPEMADGENNTRMFLVEPVLARVLSRQRIRRGTGLCRASKRRERQRNHQKLPHKTSIFTSFYAPFYTCTSVIAA